MQETRRGRKTQTGNLDIAPDLEFKMDVTSQELCVAGESIKTTQE